MRRAGAGPDGVLYPAAPPVPVVVFDAAYRRRYPVGPLEPGGPDPQWLAAPADDLAGLARVAGIPADTLEQTVKRFNAGRGVARTPTSAGARFPTTVGSETRAPLTRRWHRCARPPSMQWKSISAGTGTKADRAPTPTAGCCRHSGHRCRGSTWRATWSRRAPSGRPPPWGAPPGAAPVFGFRAGEAAAGDRRAPRAVPRAGRRRGAAPAHGARVVQELLDAEDVHRYRPCCGRSETRRMGSSGHPPAAPHEP